MLKFFRKIRQQILAENKPAFAAGRFSKYLIYAIGEIILVVIGILIALQINNWNEDRIRSLEERRVLRDLKEELAPAITRRENLILKVDEKRVELAIVLDKLFSSPARTLNNIECRSIFTIVFRANYHVPYLTVVDELIASGKISIIKDRELRKQMIGFKNRIKINEKYIKGAEEMTNYPNEYSNLISRSWEPLTQESKFICDTPEMTKSKAFLAQLQSDRATLSGLIIAATAELEILRNMDSLLNKNNY